MTDNDLTRDQLQAITTLEGNVFVAAGAGSGKTRVVTGRFVHAIATGFAAVDQILTITFTRKAAAEMMRRIRDDLRKGNTVTADLTEEQQGRMKTAYRDVERAQISTIDSFYTTILRANALAAEIDPDFKAINESQARLIREEVFDVCLRKLVEAEGGEAVELITAYDADLRGRLYEILIQAYETLQSQGKPVTLPLPGRRQLKPVEQSLRAAVTSAREAFSRLGSPTATQVKAMDKLTGIDGALAAVSPADRVRLADFEIRPGKCGAIKDVLLQVEAARELFVQVLRSELAAKTLELFQKLLGSFDELYSSEKRRRGVLDFADLSILTRDLLLHNENIRRRVAARFRLIMVDEFQDTNPLQHEIIELISDNNRFVVGDENQAIYGFRNAEVALFQKEKERARDGGYLIELTENFRSQREILDFVDFIFDRDDMLAPGYMRLEPKAAGVPEEEFRVEVILVDERRKSGAEGLQKVAGSITRPAEAQLIAERLVELFAEGYSPGDVAILIKARTDADIYRNALSRAGIENYFAVGSSYFGKLELIDTINMFKLVINPCDDLALIGALRSPLAGLSDDALYWLRNHDGESGGQPHKGPLWEAVGEQSALQLMDADDRVRLEGFVSGLNAIRRVAGRISLGSLARRIINFNDYAARIAAGHNGKQNLANLLKLLDLAAEFESSWGNDLVEFTEFLDHEKEVDSREIEAPTEEEGVKAVRIMTMHSAKGLEFPLVVLPKLQSPSKRNNPVLRLDRSGGDRIALEYKGNDGADGKAFDYTVLKDEEEQRELQELKRLGYVARTRARRHLILTGVAPADRLPKSDRKDQLPFNWIRSSLNLSWDRDDKFGNADRAETADGAGVRLNICVDPEAVASRYLQAGVAGNMLIPEAVNPGVNQMPAGASFVPPAVSPTALDTFRACPRRFYLENVLHVTELFETGATARTNAREAVLSPAEMGTLVHSLLETDMPFSGSQTLTESLIAERAAEIFGPETGLTQADRKQVAVFISRLGSLPVSAELKHAAEAGSLQRELSFATLVGQTILQGKIDALCPVDPGSINSGDEQGSDFSAAGTLVVDYKTGAPGEGRTPAEAAQTYRMQVISYALAAGRMRAGPVRVVLAFLGGNAAVEFAEEFAAADIPGLEALLQGVIDKMADGSFPALDKPDEHKCGLCAGGPNGARLCIRA